MSSATRHDESRARAVDRLCELASIGAGHAAGALAVLLARPFEMRVPEARVIGARETNVAFASDLGADENEWAGVLFEMSGGLGGTLALLLPPASRDTLLRQLLGKDASDEALAPSALREVGNIVASHALSAMGDVLGARLLPSTPRLVLRGAPTALARALASRPGAGSLLRVEVELRDRAGDVRALLVWAPSEIA